MTRAHLRVVLVALLAAILSGCGAPSDERRGHESSGAAEAEHVADGTRHIHKVVASPLPATSWDLLVMEEVTSGKEIAFIVLPKYVEHIDSDHIKATAIEGQGTRFSVTYYSRHGKRYATGVDELGEDASGENRPAMGVLAVG